MLLASVPAHTRCFRDFSVHHTLACLNSRVPEPGHQHRPSPAPSPSTPPSQAHTHHHATNPFVYHSLDAAEAALQAQQVREEGTGALLRTLPPPLGLCSPAPLAPAAYAHSTPPAHPLPCAPGLQERAQHLSAYPFAGLATSETGWTPGELAHYSTDEFRMFQFKVRGHSPRRRVSEDWVCDKGGKRSLMGVSHPPLPADHWLCTHCSTCICSC